MQYTRPTGVRKGITKEFEVGNHKARIKKVTGFITLKEYQQENF